MRKRLIRATPKRVRPEDEGWMDMDTAAVIEVSAEQKDCPIDSALLTGEAREWRTVEPGTQTAGSCSMSRNGSSKADRTAGETRTRLGGGDGVAADPSRVSRWRIQTAAADNSPIPTKLQTGSRRRWDQCLHR